MHGDDACFTGSVIHQSHNKNPKRPLKYAYTSIRGASTTTSERTRFRLYLKESNCFLICLANNKQSYLLYIQIWLWERNRKKWWGFPGHCLLKEAIIDEYQATIQKDLWGKARKLWPWVQKMSFHSSSSSLLSPLSPFPETPLYSFFKTQQSSRFLHHTNTTHVHFYPLPLSLCSIHGSVCLLTINRY